MGQSPTTLRRKPIRKEYHDLAISQSPVSRGHRPLLGDFLDREEDDLSDRIIRRKNRLRFRELAHHPVVCLDRVSRVDQIFDNLEPINEYSFVSIKANEIVNGLAA